MKSPPLKFTTIGEILAPWDVKGKLKVKVATDFLQRFTLGSMIYINRQPMTMGSTEWHNGKLIIKPNAINSTGDTQKLQGQSVEIPHSQPCPLPEGQYYHHQIIGLQVRTTQGELLGNITEVLTGASNDNYVVHGARGEILIPAIEDVVKSIDLDKGCMVIEPIQGLLSLNQKDS